MDYTYFHKSKKYDKVEIVVTSVLKEINLKKYCILFFKKIDFYNYSTNIH